MLEFEIVQPDISDYPPNEKKPKDAKDYSIGVNRLKGPTDDDDEVEGDPKSAPETPTPLKDGRENCKTAIIDAIKKVAEENPQYTLDIPIDETDSISFLNDQAREEQLSIRTSRDV